jgi:HEPN domain-containing protein
MFSQKDRVNLALGLIRTAYNDYIASRVLLNKNYTLQGVILASTAVEKYFKALILTHSGKIKTVHFDKFDVIKKAVEEIGYEVIINKMDPRFIEILTKIYPLRYYDNIKSPTSVGFFKNQFLGELDQAIYWFDKAIILSDKKGTTLSPVKRDFQNKNPDLLENNWITQKPINKKKFMETNCEGFAIYIHPKNLFAEVNVSSVKMTVPYDGSMYLINVKPDDSI